jgi:hypothetical protein
MEVPAPVEELHETHPLLDETARKEAVVRKARLAGGGPVILENVLRLLRNIHHAGHGRLHAVGELVLGNAGDGLGMGELGVLLFVQLAQGVEGLATQVAAHARRIRNEEHGITFGAALHALEDRGSEATAPASLASAWLGAARDHHHEAGQVFILGAKSISRPRPHRGTPLALEAGEEQQLGRRVVELARVHRAHHAKIVGDGLEVGHGVAHPHAGLAVLGELPRGAHQFRDTGGEGETAPFEDGLRAILPVVFHQFGFVVEEVEVRRRARHVQVDDAFRFRVEMRAA